MITLFLQLMVFIIFYLTHLLKPSIISIYVEIRKKWKYTKSIEKRFQRNADVLMGRHKLVYRNN